MFFGLFVGELTSSGLLTLRRRRVPVDTTCDSIAMRVFTTITGLLFTGILLGFIGYALHEVVESNKYKTCVEHRLPIECK
jgi:hypothetical protein